jgi:hypothetical protein
MPGTFEIVFEDQNAAVKAEFIDEAPEASMIFRKMLETPIPSQVIHGKWAGPQVYIKIPEPPQPIPPEVLIATPAPGDISYAYIPQSPVRGLTGFHELTMWYGREGFAFGLYHPFLFTGSNPLLTPGLAPGLLYLHLVATVADKQNLRRFAAACENVHRRNYQTVTLRAT